MSRAPKRMGRLPHEGADINPQKKINANGDRTWRAYPPLRDDRTGATLVCKEQLLLDRADVAM